MTGGGVARTRWLPWLALGLAVVVASMLALTSVRRNFVAACDQQEWPHFSSCPNLDEAVPLQVDRLRARIATNPGDSAAWLALALLTTQPGGVVPLNDEAVLATAIRLAGGTQLLQRVLASRALERRQWPEAVDWLVKMVQDHGDAEAARVLAAMVPLSEAQGPLRAALKPGTTWLEPVLGQLGAAKVPVVLAMPLVAQALPLKLLSPQGGQALMRSLKASGQWLEAHALWTWLVGGTVPLLYNGEFEQDFISDGFDWEPRATQPSTAGALVDQPRHGAMGRVLQVEFTGRPVALPVLRQQLALLDGAYLLNGQYMAQRMRTEQGLVWTFTCARDGRELARTPPLMDTRGQWLPFSVAVSVPPDCSGAVALQLQTQVGFEALAGLRGQMSFDAFRLTTR
jgi:hypothetical protein